MENPLLIDPANSMFPVSSDSRPTVFIVGSGAVRGPTDGSGDTSWPIIRRALSDVYGPKHPVVGDDVENFVLANVVFKMRWAYMNCIEPTASDILRETKDRTCTEYKNVVASIVRVLKTAEATREIALRKELREIEKRFLAEPTLVITTNWDSLLEDHFSNRAAVMHLHGSIMDPSLVILPSEMVQEPYRDPKALAMHMQRHAFMTEALGQAKTIVIYGLSLSPLDAELAILVGDALRNGHKPDVVVIDRNPSLIINKLRHFDADMKIKSVEIL